MNVQNLIGKFNTFKPFEVKQIKKTTKSSDQQDLKDEVKKVDNAFLNRRKFKKKKEKKKIILAFDFGTSRSGFTIYDMKGTPDTNTDWEDAPVPYPKTLTQMTYDLKQKKALNWGYTAKKWWSQQGDSDDSEDIEYLKFFKMELLKNSETIEGTNVVTVDAISCYLKFLKEKAFEKLEIQGYKNKKPSDLKICLTIPAIWKDDQKQAMKLAALRAGLIQSEMVDENDFQFVLEPEAAAMYCLEHIKHGNLKLDENSGLVIVDIGGGTLDLTSYKYINPKSMAEICKGDGMSIGSSNLDIKFWEMLCVKFGIQFMEVFKKENPEEIIGLFDTWEIFKCQKIEDLKSTYKLDLPTYLVKQLLKKDENAQHFDNKDRLVLTPDDLNYIYQDVLDKIVKKSCNYIESVKASSNLEFVFLVGGFASSILLQKELKRSIPKVEFIIPKFPGSAIVEGAAYCGSHGFEEIQRMEIISRKMRHTYGLEISSMDGNNDFYIWEEYSGCSNAFKYRGVHKFVEIDQEIKIDEVVNGTFKLHRHDVTHINILRSDERNPRVSECVEMGSMVLNHEEFGDWVEVKLIFGETLKVFYSNSDNDEQEILIKYASNLF